MDAQTNKRTNPGVWKNIGQAPVKGFLIVICSPAPHHGVANLDELNEPITGSSEAPDGIESLNSLAEYSRQFSSGRHRCSSTMPHNDRTPTTR